MLVAIVLQQNISLHLAKYGLRFYSVRFLFCATGAIISGSTVLALMEVTPFQPNDIDFYCPKGSSLDVRRYLLLAGRVFNEHRLSNDYNELCGIGVIWTLLGTDSCKVNVIESLSPIARDSVLLFHSTPVFGAIDGAIFWHGEPCLTFDKKALTTPHQLPLSTNLYVHQRAWKVVHKYMERGFRYITEYDLPHRCGVHPSCPITLRTASDRGCLRVPLPPFPFDFPSPPHETSWTLGRGGCTTHITHDSKAVSLLRDIKWFATFKELLSAKVEPQDIIQYHL
ncbi:hypothetical protein C8J57DRAFT_1537071 [Mycena rebaudengoi]|nr:hypothetical protein C8J57DRAFT_1537071 [Mycena rebaudengoi]